jgi:hypothetical protein
MMVSKVNSYGLEQKNKGIEFYSNTFNIFLYKQSNLVRRRNPWVTYTCYEATSVDY